MIWDVSLEKSFPQNSYGKKAPYSGTYHFCQIWKSQSVSFEQAIEELKTNFKIVENYRTEENVLSQFKYEFIPKKNEFHLTNFIVYD